MLEARMRGWNNQRCEVDQDGLRLTELAFERREAGAFTLLGHPYEITRRNRRKEFVLAGSQGDYAVARQSGRHWAITADSGHYELVKPRLLRMAWEIHRDGRQVGALRKRGAFTRTIDTVGGPDLPLPLEIFSLYLVVVWLRRQQAGAAAGTAGG